MIVPISALVALTTAIDQQALGRGRLAPEFVNRWLPFLALGAAYVLLRWYLFGGPFQVYASRPVVWDVDLRLALRSIWQWFGGLVPQAAVRWPIAMLVPAVLGWVAWRAKARPQVAWVTLGAVIAALIAFGVVLPHKSAFAATGEDARFFYTASAFFRSRLPRGDGGNSTTRYRQCRSDVVWVIMALSTIAPSNEHRRWVSCERHHACAAPRLHAEASTLPPHASRAGVDPGPPGAAPFAATQRRPSAATAAAAAAVGASRAGHARRPWRVVRKAAGWNRGRALHAFARRRLSSTLLPPESPMPARFVPTNYFCWKPAEGSLVKLSGIDASDASRWKASSRRALAAAGCEALARSVR